MFSKVWYRVSLIPRIDKDERGPALFQDGNEFMGQLDTRCPAQDIFQFHQAESTPPQFVSADPLLQSRPIQSGCISTSWASARLPMVALMPQTLTGWVAACPAPAARMRARASSTCTPRLLPYELMPFVNCQDPKFAEEGSISFWASNRCRLSGVMIRISGIRAFCFGARQPGYPVPDSVTFQGKPEVLLLLHRPANILGERAQRRNPEQTQTTRPGSR